MMPKIKRKRLVVLALLAFFCCGAVVGIDWRRLGGAFVAFFKGKHEPVLVLGGRSPADGSAVAASRNPTSRSTPPRLTAASARRRAQGADDAAGGHGQDDEDDLFKYGLPAAGGIPAGSFVVAQNDEPVGGNPVGPESPNLSVATSAGPGAGDAVTGPAPGPLTGPTDAGLTGGKAPSSPSPSPSPAAPAPAPSQSGTGDQDPGGDLGSTPPSAPVSTVPETSPLAMTALAALFIAVAASRRRQA
jgi:hypothetical protein